MRTVEMRLRFPDEFSEFVGNDVELVGLMIENVVAEALLQFFDTVMVDDVTVQHIAENSNADTVQSSIK